MGAIRVALTFVVLLFEFVVILGGFVAVSMAVLWAVGRALPLAGRGRRRE